MSADKMLALAERCEAATGPDRELDVLIRETLNPVGYRKQDRVTYYGEPTGEHVIDGHFVKSPACTASLDAAISLMPRGGHWSYNTMSGRARVTVFPDGDDDTIETQATASTPALALTAACLRALASKDNSHA
jgi:hypothetical protein